MDLVYIHHGTHGSGVHALWYTWIMCIMVHMDRVYISHGTHGSCVYKSRYTWIWSGACSAPDLVYTHHGTCTCMPGSSLVPRRSGMRLAWILCSYAGGKGGGDSNLDGLMFTPAAGVVLPVGDFIPQHHTWEIVYHQQRGGGGGGG